jgi:hypothetical protein
MGALKFHAAIDPTCAGDNKTRQALVRLASF